MVIRRSSILPALLAAGAAALLVGCGGSGQSTSSTAAPATVSTSAGTAAPATTTAPPASTAASGPVGGLTGEATSLATGDIPDNQVFLTFDNPSGGWSMKYPEGWAQSGSAGDILFQDKNNLVHVVIRDGAAPTVASVEADLATLAAGDATFKAQKPAAATVGGKPMIKAVYEKASAPNPVTGKQVNLIVDRYAFAQNGKVAVVDLGTPKGVDNVDGYRLMIESFKWK
jgi:hypothetical protein